VLGSVAQATGIRHEQLYDAMNPFALTG